MPPRPARAMDCSGTSYRPGLMSGLRDRPRQRAAIIVTGGQSMQHIPEIACSKCRYWQVVESSPEQESVGECRINPPIFHAVLENYRSGESRHSMMEESITSRDTLRPKQYLGAAQSFWPMTRGGDWCGKFEQRAITQDQRNRQ